MRHSISMILLSAGVVLSLTGCQKDPSKNNLSGKAVRFSATSASAETRTAFSGDGTQDGSNTDEFGRKILTWERIDWKVDDQVMIASDNATVYNNSNKKYAIYTVESVTPNGQESEARVEEMDGDQELFFTDADSYTFWGVYPAAAGNGTTLGNGQVSLVIPAEQNPTGTPGTMTKDGKTLTILQPDMSNAVMLAKEENVTSETVDLKFYPAFTAFEFTLCAKEDVEIPLKKVVFSSNSSLSGSVTATLAAAGATTYTEPAANGKITVTFPDNTVITNTQYLTFTIFALPQEINGLTMEFYVGTDTTTPSMKGTLKKDGSDIKFAAGKKHSLRGIAVKSGWEFSVLDFNLTTLWEDVTFASVSSQDYPQSMQFQVSGDVDNIYDDLNGPKSLRQCWVFNKADGVATVTFKIMQPKGGTWRIVPQALNDGDLDAFIITPSTLSGSIGNDGSTRITFTIKPAEGMYGTNTPYIIYFKTYVTNAAGTEFSLDSETQLYDMRGYHYFILNTTNPQI